MFKNGDKVKIKKILKGHSGYGHSYEEKKEYLRKEYTITDISAHYGQELNMHLSMGGHVDWAAEELKLINDENKMDNIKEKFVAIFLKEPQKSFRKAGVTNGDGFLTDEGTELFLSWLLHKNGDTFKTEVVDELLRKEKEDK